MLGGLALRVNHLALDHERLLHLVKSTVLQPRRAGAFTNNVDESGLFENVLA